jgi:hypothetical protein
MCGNLHVSNFPAYSLTVLMPSLIKTAIKKTVSELRVDSFSTSDISNFYRQQPLLVVCDKI